MMWTTFSLTHHIDFEGDPSLLLFYHPHHLHNSWLDDCLLNDIYLHINLLILWWMLLIPWVPWISCHWIEISSFSVIIQCHHTGQLKRISQHSPCYILMCYPQIFPHVEEGWHPLIPLRDIDLLDNGNLHVCRWTHVNSESENDEDIQDAPRHGWGGSTRVSQSQYYAIQLQNCDSVFSPLLNLGWLCQEYCFDAWVCAESNCLQ